MIFGSKLIVSGFSLNDLEHDLQNLYDLGVYKKKRSLKESVSPEMLSSGGLFYIYIILYRKKVKNILRFL